MINKLEWDSKFFNKNIANLDITSLKINFDKVENFVKNNKIDIIQTLAPSNKINLINDLENHFFKMEESVVTFTKKITKINYKNDENIKIANIEHLDYMKKYLNGIFKESRYKRIVSKELIDSFYYTWLKKAILGKFDDICFIYELDNLPIAFITLKINNKKANIGLIAVSPNFQGKGIGYKLIQHSERFLLQKGVEIFNVRTQGSNILAQNFYIKNSFFIDSLKFWFYKVY